MKIGYSQEEYNLATSSDKLKCYCYNCKRKFFKEKKLITQELTHNRGRNKYCNVECCTKAKSFRKKVKCTNCDIKFEKALKEFKKSKSGNHFCTSSCSAIYNNKNKTYGIRRSKMEKWMEEKLTDLLPDLEIHFNRKDTINSELDIYFPTKNIAIELNGIHHYKPIYGDKKFKQTQRNDIKKRRDCSKKNIEIHHIDISKQHTFKESTSQIYLDRILELLY